MLFKNIFSLLERNTTGQGLYCSPEFFIERNTNYIHLGFGFKKKLVSVQCFKSFKYLFPGKENHRDNSNFQAFNETTHFPFTVIIIAQLFPEPIFFPFSRGVHVCVLASSCVSPTLWFLYELLPIFLWRKQGRNKPFSSHTYINAGPTRVPLDISRIRPVNLLCLHHYSQTTFQEYSNPRPT